MDVKEFIACELIKSNINTFFTLPAYYITALTAYFKKAGLNLVELRSEYNVGFAATSYAKIKNKIGVMCVNIGPSLTNSLTAIKTASKEQIPLLVIVGAQSILIHNNESFFQTINDISGVSKGTYIYDNHDQTIIQKCIDIAQEHPRGPVILKVPYDILNDKVNQNCNMDTVLAPLHKRNKYINELKNIICMMNKYDNPLFLFGQGLRDYKILRNLTILLLQR